MDTKKLRQKVLDLAIRGKLVPQNPNDESASVLLERIYAEKQKLISEGKIKREKRSSFIFKGEDNSYYEKVVENGKETIVNIDDEIPFDIPEKWIWCRLGSIATKIHYGYTASAADNGSVRLLRITDIQNDDVNWNKVPFCDKDPDDIESYRLSKNDILIARTGGTIGKSYMISKEIEDLAVFASYLIRIVLAKEVSASFIKLYLDTSLYWQLLVSKSMGIGQPNVNGESLKSLLLPLPSLKEQKKIVKFVENLMTNISQIDGESPLIEEKISLAKSKLLDLAIRGKLLAQDENDEPASELLKRIREEKESAQLTSKGKRKTAVSYIFKGEDNLYYEKIGTETKCIQDEIPFDIPQSWAWTRFSSIVDFKLGKTPDRNNDDYWNSGKYSWVSISDMKPNPYIYKTKEMVSEKAFKIVFKGNISTEGTLLMSFKLTVGRVSILAMDAFHNEAIISILPIYSKGNIIRNYLFNILPLISKSGDSHDAIKGTTLNSKSLSKLFIPLPPLLEQKRISEFLKSAFAQLDSLIQH